MLTRRLITSIKNPILWFGMIILAFSLVRTLSDDLSNVIRSDGRGYYAYLPALIIFNDSSFTASWEAETAYLNDQGNPSYLIRNAEGEVHNKYFPGIAILQLPFFLIAIAVSWLTGQSIDGYSDTYSLWFFIGSLCYVLLGLHFLTKVCSALFPTKKIVISWLIPLVYLATPLFHYSTNTPSFSHLYSVFLFAWFLWLVLQITEGKKRLILAGIVLGLIVLVRPPNLLILAAIPLVLGTRDRLHLFVQRLFTLRSFLAALGGFLSVVFILLLIWKWESGSWLVWSYGGEGFNFLQPKFIPTLLSFRIGLFVHTPLVLLAALCFFGLYRNHKFQAFWWLAYFMLITWTIASWWCWDYESSFGHRPFTEHLIILLFPLMFVLDKRKWMLWSGIVACALIGLIRLWSFNTGYLSNQRFSADNYFSSLAIWKEQNYGRWNFTQSCVPFGDKIAEEILFDQPGIQCIDSTIEFSSSCETELTLPRTNERFYYRVELEKQVSSSDKFERVYLVVDAYNSETGQRFYAPMEITNDRQYPPDEWQQVIIEGTIHDNFQDYDRVKIYIWNVAKRNFELRNVRITLKEYKS